MALAQVEIEWVYDQIMSMGYDFMDNFRYAEVGDEEEEARFEQIERDGCCGSYEEIREYNGKKIRIGFNYGH